jgi:hypothetical protein
MKQTELLGVIALLTLSATLVSGSLRLPPSLVLLLSSPITKIILVLGVIYIFTKSPALGIAATVALAVILFSRNIALVSSEGSFLTDLMNSFHTTNSAKDQLDPAPAPDSYPTDRVRPEGTPETRSYSFHPSEDTGSDEFARFGPNLDEKIEVLR